MEIALAIILFLLGLSVGSFLNVVADRVPTGKSIVSPPSHCFNCGHKLGAMDLFPVISYIFLKGKCRYCGASIPIRSLLVELASGVIFVLAFSTFGAGWQLLPALIYSSIFILLAITDMENGRVPLKIIIPCFAVAIVIDIANIFTGSDPDLLNAATGIAISSVFFLLIWGVPRLFKARVLDFSDVLIGGLAGAAVGFPLIAAAILLALITGGVTAAILWLWRLRKLTEPIAFTPFIAFGTLAALFLSNEINYLTQVLFS